ncbi:MAG: peptidylprolyl isomerase [Candidatus Dormibacteraeota bacterium]|nr:peptidylprolyl isomerase [Candidatus Dormibacteraeota bacterium]
MRRISACLLAVFCVACGSVSAPSPTPSSEVIARVGSTAITSALFQLRLKSTLTSVSLAGGPTGNAAMTAQVRAGVLRSLLIDAVIAQEAAAAGVAATAAEIQSQIGQDAASAGGMSQLQSQLASLGGSLAQLTDEVRSSLNEQQLEDLFAKQRASEVEGKLGQGASVASLAPLYSDDSASAPKGGELGSITRATISSGDGAFSTAVLALAVGQYTTTPVRDSQGYDIVQVEAASAAALTLRHIIVAAPQPYSARQRPAWFSEAIFEQLATDCAANQIAVYISNVGDNPCAAASPSASPGATPSP